MRSPLGLPYPDFERARIVTVIRPYGEEDGARWDAFVRAHPESHFGQRIAWKRVTERGYGCASDYRVASRDGRVVGILPLFAKRSLRGAHVLFSAPGGLLAADEAAAAALVEHARARTRASELAYLELRDQLRAWPGLETVEEHCTQVLELAADPDAQWAALGSKLRNVVKKGQSFSFRAEIGRDAVEDFHVVLSENMRDLGTPILGAAYYRSVLEAFGEEAWLVMLYDGALPVGGMLLIAHGDTVHLPWASCRRSYRSRSANSALYWEALRDCVERGFRWFDFGRSQWQSSTFAFKEQWGATPRPLYYQYALGRAKRAPTTADLKGAFELAVKTWQRLPLSLARRLGPLARRHFPEAI